MPLTGAGSARHERGFDKKHRGPSQIREGPRCCYTENSAHKPPQERELLQHPGGRKGQEQEAQQAERKEPKRAEAGEVPMAAAQQVNEDRVRQIDAEAAFGQALQQPGMLRRPGRETPAECKDKADGQRRGELQIPVVYVDGLPGRDRILNLGSGAGPCFSPSLWRMGSVCRCTDCFVPRNGIRLPVFPSQRQSVLSQNRQLRG